MCALVSALHRERVHAILPFSVLPAVIKILQLFIKAYSQSFSEHNTATLSFSRTVLMYRILKKEVSVNFKGFDAFTGRHTHQSGCVNVQWGHLSFDRHNCTGDTWRVSPPSGALCGAGDSPSEWMRRHTGCNGKDVPLRTQHKEEHIVLKKVHQ